MEALDEHGHGNDVTSSIERNIKYYPLYRAAADAMAWLPIFFLYFSERLSLAEVLLLEAVYYVAVVFTEVPSGYLSDIAGRRRTLLLSCLAVLVAYLCFIFSNNFAGLAAGQVLLAVSIAFRSGTDTAFLYESLQSVNRENEYGDSEALAGKYGFASTAIAALAGGFLGSINLAWPYYLSFITALIACYVVYCFTEPGKKVDSGFKPGAGGFLSQIQQCVAYLSHPLLKWLFVYTVFMYAVVHIPYEFYQPYLGLLQQDGQLPGTSAPMVAGLLFAATAVVASVASAYSMTLKKKAGLTNLLLSAAALEVIIISAMAVLLHPLISLTLVLRSGPMAVVTAPVNSAIAPHIDNQHRATYLSLMSLASRLAFALLLFGFAKLVPHTNATDWQSLSLLLRVSAVAGACGLMMFFIFARSGMDDSS